MTVEIIAIDDLPEVVAGQDLVTLLADELEGLIAPGDIVVVASKIVSKAQGRTTPVPEGLSRDEARVALASQDEVVSATPWVTIVRTPEGLVCANAGIDASNVPGGALLLLPEAPDEVADEIRRRLCEQLNVLRLGVVITDTFGRAWREGQTDVAIGVSGIAPLRDERGTLDRHGNRMSVTLVAVADQIAGAADLVRDKAAGIPLVLVRGMREHVLDERGAGAAALIRAPETDLFAHGRGWLGRRLATGEGAAVRNGLPDADEWDLILAAAGAPSSTAAATGTARVELPDGLAAGRAEAVLLDLGYDAVAGADATGWHVQVHEATGR